MQARSPLVPGGGQPSDERCCLPPPNSLQPLPVKHQKEWCRLQKKAHEGGEEKEKAGGLLLTVFLLERGWRGRQGQTGFH